MKIVALMKVRNEQWVLRASLPAILRAVDEVVILDHCSTDATPEIIRETARAHPGRVHALRDDNPVWAEADLRQRMVDAARSIGGTHLAPIDADEILSANLLPRFRALYAELARAQSLWLPWIPLWRSLHEWRDDNSIWSRGRMLIAFRDAPHIRFRPRHDGYDIHVRIPPECRDHTLDPVHLMQGGGLLHLQFAHRRRLIAKAAWYKMNETIRYPRRSTPEQLEAKYNPAVDETGLRLSRCDPAWWAEYEDLLPLIDLEDEPWHAAECRRLWSEHGGERFQGLRLWGVPEGEVRDAPDALREEPAHVG